MWRGNNLVQCQKRIGCLNRFFAEDIEPRGFQVSGLERIEKSGLIDQPAPRRVDQDRARPHRSEFLCADELVCFDGQRNMQRNDVGDFEKFRYGT
ncbi:MAG: hypothetical protein R3C04_08935 [Hyphomonas sp.]